MATAFRDEMALAQYVRVIFMSGTESNIGIHIARRKASRNSFSVHVRCLQHRRRERQAIPGILSAVFRLTRLTSLPGLFYLHSTQSLFPLFSFLLNFWGFSFAIVTHIQI